MAFILLFTSQFTVQLIIFAYWTQLLEHRTHGTIYFILVQLVSATNGQPWVFITTCWSRQYGFNLVRIYHALAEIRTRITRPRSPWPQPTHYKWWIRPLGYETRLLSRHLCLVRHTNKISYLHKSCCILLKQAFGKQHNMLFLWWNAVVPIQRCKYYWISKFCLAVEVK